MTATYERRGVCFAYPENWELYDSPDDRFPREVALETPGGGMWVVHVFPPDSDRVELARGVLSTLRQQYQQVEALPIREQIAGCETEGYDVAFFCLDFLIAAKIRATSTEEFTFVVLSQAEDSEFEKMERVFSAITTSLLRPR